VLALHGSTADPDKRAPVEVGFPVHIIGEIYKEDLQDDERIT